MSCSQYIRLLMVIVQRSRSLWHSRQCWLVNRDLYNGLLESPYIMGSIIPYTKQPTRGPTDHCWGSTSGIIGIFSCGGEPICQGFPEGFLAVSGKVWRNHGFRFYHNILSMVQKSGQPPRMSKTLKIMRNNYHINRWSPDVFFPSTVARVHRGSGRSHGNFCRAKLI